ncbi:unnamed protein product [Prorocentrum cordatum]|uniref:CCHC-type domain-containing protein n=1 Tax=Prorocentrum cordatum TaxID=2364126 RepID=A0ABN9X3I5_9DINO|nr:unnamed protein product [Polarella glacialis]
MAEEQLRLLTQQMEQLTQRLTAIGQENRQLTATVTSQQQQISQLQQAGGAAQRGAAAAAPVVSNESIGLLIEALSEQTRALSRRDRPVLVDVKGIGRPYTFTNDESKFPEWCKKVEDYLLGVEPQLAAALEWALEQEDEFTTAEAVLALGPNTEHAIDDIAALNLQIKSVLSNLTEGESWTIVQNCDRNGLEAWRRLHRRFDALTGGRRRALLRAILSPHRVKLEEVGTALQLWEEMVTRYNKKQQRLGEAPIADEYLCSALEALVPEDVENHLQMNANRLKKYSDMRAEMVTFYEARTGKKVRVTLQERMKSASSGGPAPMDVDSLQGYCDNCGKWGHKKADCWGKPQDRRRHKGDPKGGASGRGGRGPKGARGKGAASLEEAGDRGHEPETEQASLELGAFDVRAAPPSVAPVAGVDDEGYTKFNLDTGAAVTAFPRSQFGSGHPDENHRGYVTASGERIPDCGGSRLVCTDEHGQRRGITGRKTDVHKVLASASQVFRGGKQVAWLTEDGGYIIPRDGPVAKAIANVIQRHEQLESGKTMLPVYQEKGVYNFYLKVNTQEEIGAVSKTKEETMPILVIKDRTTKGYAATAIPRKGVHLFNIKFFAGAVKELGWKKMVSKSDGEHSLVALKQAVSDSMPGVEMVMQESPDGDHPANGEAENAVKEVKRLVRVHKATLEERIGKKLPVDHPLWTWLPRHAAACLSRYRIGPDGRTAEQRRTGRAWAKAAVEFGERIHARPAVPREPRSGFAPKMVEGRYVGHQSRTGSLLVMTSTGVIRAKAFNRMQEGERWTSEGLEDLKGVPWQMVPPAAGSTAPAPAAGSPAPARAPPLAAGAEAAADAARVAHSVECTQRMKAHIEADVQQRRRVDQMPTALDRAALKRPPEDPPDDPRLETADDDVIVPPAVQAQAAAASEGPDVAMGSFSAGKEELRRMYEGRIVEAYRTSCVDLSSSELDDVTQMALELELRKQSSGERGSGQPRAQEPLVHVKLEGPVPVAPEPYEAGRESLDDDERYWDDVNGGWLDPQMVREERRREVQWLHKQDVYEKRTIEECRQVTGQPPIKLMWIDTNKGDHENPNYRSRIVVREKRGKGEEGKANPALFYNMNADLRSLVHGDDFCALGDDEALDELEKTLRSKYDLKVTGSLRLGARSDQEVVFLNRILRVAGPPGDERFEVEADPRHAEMIVAEMGLAGEKTKALDAPGLKKEEAEHEERETSPLLTGDAVKQYRSVTMRAAYLSPDRADIGDAVKNLAKYMQSPRQVDAVRLKRLARYLKGRPRVVQKFTRDRNTANDDVVKVVIMVDSDTAGDKVSRRSTVGQVAFVGKHVVKHMCNILQVIGLSSGENEYYAISAGACTGLGIKGILEDWNVVCELKVVSDSSAARGFSSRRGVGKQKHIQTRYLWVQERLAMRHLDLGKFGTKENRADLLTKPLTKKEMEEHMKGINQEFREGRAQYGLRLL